MTNFPRAHRIVISLLATGVAAFSLILAAGAAAAPIGAFTTKGSWHFVSAPGLHPPVLKVRSRKSGLAPGYFLAANLPSVGHPGPMTGEGGPLILDNKLRPVWFHGVGTHVGAADLLQETFEGQPVLLWWEGVVSATGATTSGRLFVVNEHYRQVATLKAPSPWVISLHDASIVPNTPDIWVTAYRKVSANLKPYGGSRHGTVYDVGLQEYNLKTGHLIKTWDALKGLGGKPNVPLSQSRQPAPKHGIWDAYHLNSLQVLPNGQLLVSMRNTWAVYLVNPVSNKIIWTLGGKKSFFNFGPGAKFAWQHHAEMLPNGNVTLFNDNCTVNTHGQLACLGGHPSAGLVLHLNVATRKATRAKAYRHSPNLKSAFLGSMQLLPNGGAVVGWGSLPYFTEHAKSGRQLLNVQWPGKDESYRVLYTQKWVGTPFYPPSGAAKGSTIYASWNGATQVASWQVLGGSTSNHLKMVGSQARGGFETAIKVSKTYKAYEVQALDSHGKVLGTSKPFS